MTATEQKVALIEIAASIIEVIRASGTRGTPAGHLYAVMMGHCSLEQFEQLMSRIANTGLITKKNDCYYFVGLSNWLGTRKTIPDGSWTHGRRYRNPKPRRGIVAMVKNKSTNARNWFYGQSFNGRLPVRQFVPRFVPSRLLADLSNLWHLSRVPHNDKYNRMLWTSNEFGKLHPELNLSSTAIYKDLDAMLAFGGR